MIPMGRQKDAANRLATTMIPVSGAHFEVVMNSPFREGQDTAMSAGYVGILSIELRFPEAGSLKGKRKYVQSAKAQLRERFGAAVAEVDHHDLWQRAGLAAAIVARGHRELGELLDAAERYLSAQEYELVRAERSIVRLDD